MQAERKITGPTYEVVVQICEAGHVLTFRQGEQTVVEIITAERQLFPQHKRLLDRKIQGCRNAACQPGGGVEYQASFQLERLEPVVFHRCHEELLLDCRARSWPMRFPWGIVSSLIR